MEELFHLQEERLLDRVIFIMPPEQTLRVKRAADDLWSDEFKVSRLWELTREKLKSRGIPFPAFMDTTDDGARVFVIRNGRCRLAHVLKRHLSQPKQLARIMEAAPILE
jgi:hypothetical protein